MAVNFFIPKQINVGFQKRQSTYTGKLAYIIYFDEKGKLRKETSWNSWRDKDIDNELHDNKPLSGFVLNKKAGGYATGWNHRQTYVRVYDPRGFEFEITISNLLYILENATSTKGKGLEGDFIYGWDGADLVLIPCEAPDYKELAQYNAKVHNSVKLKGKDMKLGGTYLSKRNQKLVYMGRFDEFSGWGMENKGKAYFFYCLDTGNFTTIKTLSTGLIDIIDEECVDNYAELMDKLEGKAIYSPLDPSKTEYLDYTLEEFLDICDTKKDNYRVWQSLYISKGNEFHVYNKPSGGYKTIYYERVMVERSNWTGTRMVEENKKVKHEFDTLEELFEFHKPKYKREYLRNGRIYSYGR